MRTQAIIVGLGLVVGIGILPPTRIAIAQGYSQEQQQLCSNDAFRLCGPDIPDVDRVTACMVRQRALLSPGCQSVFRPAQAAATTPTQAGRPINIRAKASKARKAKKQKQ